MTAPRAITARVIGLGQRLGGDDAVGLAVLDRLRAEGDAGSLELVAVEDASALIEALLSPLPVVIVDAVLGAGPPGSIHRLGAADLGRSAIAAVSTHGLDVRQAIALARTLHPDEVSPDLALIGIAIATAARFTEGLSPAVLAAVGDAARAVRAHTEHPGGAPA